MIDHETRQDRISKFLLVDKELHEGAVIATEVGDETMLAIYGVLRSANCKQVADEQLTEEVFREGEERE